MHNGSVMYVIYWMHMEGSNCSNNNNPKHMNDVLIYILLQPFNGLFSRTTWVSRQQKGKPLWTEWLKNDQVCHGCDQSE